MGVGEILPGSSHNVKIWLAFLLAPAVQCRLDPRGSARSATIGKWQQNHGRVCTMARSVKIEALDKGLENDLPKIAAGIDPDLLAILEASESKLALAFAAGIVGFTGAELTEADTEALAEINADLLESAGKWDRSRSDLIVANAGKIAKLAAKLAEDPVALTEAITEDHGKQAEALAKIAGKQAEAESDLAIRKAGIENKQAIAGIAAFRKVLKYTEAGSSVPSSRFALADHDWIVVDLSVTRSHYGIFVLQGSTRRVWYYGIASEIGIGKPGLQVDRETWIEAGNMVDHTDCRTPTGAQRWFYAWLDYASQYEEIEELTLYVNTRTANGNLKTGDHVNSGGSACVSRIVAIVDPEGGRQETFGKIAEKYKFDLDTLVPVLEEIEAEAEAKAAVDQAEDQAKAEAKAEAESKIEAKDPEAEKPKAKSKPKAKPKAKAAA